MQTRNPLGTLSLFHMMTIQVNNVLHILFCLIKTRSKRQDWESLYIIILVYIHLFFQANPVPRDRTIRVIIKN